MSGRARERPYRPTGAVFHTKRETELLIVLRYHS